MNLSTLQAIRHGVVPEPFESLYLEVDKQQNKQMLFLNLEVDKQQNRQMLFLNLEVDKAAEQANALHLPVLLLVYFKLIPSS